MQLWQCHLFSYSLALKSENTQAFIHTSRSPMKNVCFFFLSFLHLNLLQKNTQGRSNIKVLEHEGQTIQHQDTIKHVSVFPQQSHPYV